MSSFDETEPHATKSITKITACDRSGYFVRRRSLTFKRVATTVLLCLPPSSSLPHKSLTFWLVGRNRYQFIQGVSPWRVNMKWQQVNYSTNVDWWLAIWLNLFCFSRNDKSQFHALFELTITFFHVCWWQVCLQVQCDNVCKLETVKKSYVTQKSIQKLILRFLVWECEMTIKFIPPYLI